MAEIPQHRQFLDPEKGENLPKKQVSAKAYTRLGLAADAIAETKKAIPKQGNQIEALKSSNMNSRYRLQVMRDDSCWEFTNDTSRKLANQHFEAYEAAKADLAHGGNCGENAWVAYHYLRLHAKGEHIQMAAAAGLDHAFVLMGDLKKDTDAEIAVSDPWPNKPTACLWEDHFAYVPDRANIEDNASMVADGQSFKAAIAAGLKLSAHGEAMVKQADSDEQTKQQTDNWKANHFWQQPDTVQSGKKYEYKPTPTAPQQTAQTDQQPDAQQP